MNDVPELVWHYTGAEALINILQTHRLRATSAAFMNDSNELLTHENAMRATYERMRNHFSCEEQEVLDPQYRDKSAEQQVRDRFLISAADNGDSLTLWRNYGGDELAVSIALDTTIPLMPVLQTDVEKHPSPPEGYYEYDADEEGRRFLLYDSDEPRSLRSDWKKVNYVAREGTPDHFERLREEAEWRLDQKRNKSKPFISLDFTSMLPDAIQNLDKDAAFEDEREFRVVVTASPDWKFVRYRASSFGLTPYVELAAKPGSNDMDFEPAAGKENLPIRKVMIGPTSHQKRQRESLRNLLDARGYRDVEIEVSSIPFR